MGECQRIGSPRSYTCVHLETAVVMYSDLRTGFHHELLVLDSRLVDMFAAVVESLALAHRGHGSAPGELDPALVDAVLAEREIELDAWCREVDTIVQAQLATQQPVGRDLRLLVTAIRIAPELERSHDLVVHAAHRADALSRACKARRADLEAMAEVVGVMWRTCAEAYTNRDPMAVYVLGEQDGEIDELNHRVLAAIGRDDIEPAAAIELALTARFYERLGDHAVHLAARIRFLSLGSR